MTAPEECRVCHMTGGVHKMGCHPQNRADAARYAPEVPHADLIARLREASHRKLQFDVALILTEAAAALAALGDTVPREHYDREAVSAASFERALRQAEDQRAEARAERDALAHVIEQAPHATSCRTGLDAGCTCFKSTAPAVSLALHDAEVKAQALDDLRSAMPGGLITPRGLTLLRARAAAIREEAGQ